jgi:hypothetical protein
MKAGIKHYYSPTPKNLRKWGDMLLAVSTFITASAVGVNNHTIAYIALGVGIIGKFLTNFFAEDKT